ncbi:methyltransferase family protein [Pengzhenrongella frigida]|uniref:Isoprenylcysteine carboxylmethyltransferase family protein n=1 Tax=Pengzhenrongella frigida TaxID=1259133 RepID=A0A4Q5N3A3_9MICO|nr:isoprenylcysteine carboxylmethyltransferase family protein [Cellulomonas sp. HLT2-17]RYV52702.1 isoprenylcysteine carboxylmethyltransferase family protein [Cellulomonas sp. HLT2-17]
MSPTEDHDPMTDRATTPSGSAHRPQDVRTARLLVAAQFALIAVIVVLPGRDDWPVPRALAVACLVAVVVGVLVMALGATGLGRGLTAAPLPNAHARLRTGGLYGFVRHPIYSGLLLLMGALAVASGSVLRLLFFGLLVALLHRKARWEEGHLAARFADYPAYARRTPRFVPFWRPR